MRIQLLHPVGDDPAGAVLEVDERRAQRLVRTGYAVETATDPPRRREDRRAVHKEAAPCPKA